MTETHVHGPHNSYFSRPYHKNLPINSVYHTILTREYISTHHGVHHTRLLTNMKKSEHFIEKLSPWKVLRGHRGCVNSVLFSDNGEFIYTGSDDTRINIYTTHSGELVSSIPTIHTQNIFYAKDFPQQSNMVDYLLSCGADGKVILTNIQRSQSLPRHSNSTQTRIGSGKLLYRHQGRSHRISMIPGEPYHFFTCGEDGMCCLFDLRDKMQNLFGNYDNLPVQEELQSQLERNQLPVLKIQFRPHLLSANMSSVSRDLQDRAPQSAYCIGVNPFHPYEVAVGGTHTKVALFDIRNHQKAFGYLCPEHMLDSHTAHVTGLKYSYNGQHLIASYNDDDVYSFHIQRHTRLLQDDESRAANGTGLWNSACNAMSSLFSRFRRPPVSSNDSSVPVVNCFDPDDAELDGDGDEEPQGFYRRYNGHRNSDTVKQVAFMGNQSEWVISGSDCGHIFIWNTHTSKLTKVLYGDKVGAVNCLASHPHLPLLATSGLENNAKLWYPLSDATSLEKDQKEKEKVDNIIQSNQERQRAFPVSSRVLRRIIRLLSQSAFAEAEDGEEEEEEEGTMTSGTRRSSEEIDDGEGQQRRRRRRISLNEVNALLPLLSVAFGYGGPSSDEDEDDDDHEEDEEEEDEENDEEEMEEEEHAVRRSRRSDGEEGSEEEDEEGSDEEEEDEYESGFEEGVVEVDLEKDDEDDDEDEDEDDEMEDDERREFENIDGDTTKDIFEDSEGEDNSNKSSEFLFHKRSSLHKLSENQFQEEAAIDVLETSTERDLLINEDEQIV